MTTIDEAALKAGISDEEILDVFCDGKYELNDQGLISFARALLHRSQGQEPQAYELQSYTEWAVKHRMLPPTLTYEPPENFPGTVYRPLYAHPAPVAVVPAEQAEDSAMRKDAMRWQYVKGIARHELSWRGRTWTFDLASNSANLDAATDAASAAVGRNREAGGS